MDNWFIFQYHRSFVTSEGVTQKGRLGAALEMLSSKLVGV